MLKKLYSEILLGEPIEINIEGCNRSDYTPAYVGEYMCKIMKSERKIKESFMRHSDVICFIFPEFKKCVGFNQNNKYHEHDVYEHTLNVVDNCLGSPFIVRLAALFHDIGKPDAYVEDSKGHGHFYGHPQLSYEICVNNILNKMQLSNFFKIRLLDLVRFHDMNMENTYEAVDKMIRMFGSEFVYNWLRLKQADLDDHVFPNGTPEWYIDTHSIKLKLDYIEMHKDLVTLENLFIDSGIIEEILGIKGKEHINKIIETLLFEVNHCRINNNPNILLDRAMQLNEQFKN